MGFGQVRQDGIARMDTILIATEIVAPLMLQLMLMLCLPYAVVKGGCLLAGMSPIEMAAPVRFSYGALGLGGLSLKAAYASKALLGHLHDRVRDSKYLLGRRLHNLEHRRFG